MDELRDMGRKSKMNRMPSVHAVNRTVLGRSDTPRSLTPAERGFTFPPLGGNQGAQFTATLAPIRSPNSNSSGRMATPSTY